VEKCGRAGQATDDNMAHAHCMVYTSGYEHTIGICNTYCFFTAAVVAQKRLNFTFIRALSALLNTYINKVR